MNAILCFLQYIKNFIFGVQVTPGLFGYGITSCAEQIPAISFNKYILAIYEAHNYRF